MPEITGPAAPGTLEGKPPSVVMTAERIREIFDRQRANRWKVRATSAEVRISKLKAMKGAIGAHREEILDAMHADFRKSRTEAELSEIQLVLTELNHAIAHVPRWLKSVRVRTPPHLLGTRSEIRYEPKGVVLIMAAWNYPFALLFAPLLASVAAGNCAMLRPAEKVPHTSMVARRILAEVFDEEEVALIGGGLSSAKALLDLPFDHIFFTGSTAVGAKILSAASTHLPSVTLELGGKCPVVIDETADLDHAARSVVFGKFINAGQTCVAPDYVFVHESRAQPFYEAARRTLSSFYGATEDERQASDDYCRIIDAPNCQRLARLLGDAVRAGATIEAGGRVRADELYVAPTILSGVTADSPLMAGEIFGPLLPVLTYRGADEIFRFMEARPKPLAMYVFSRSQEKIDEMLARTSAGGTVINNCLLHLLNPDLPFGGTGASGFGCYHGRFGFETFSHARAVVVQGWPQLSHLFHPPYARLRSGWLGSILAAAKRLRG